MRPLVQMSCVSKVYPRVHRPGERARAFGALLLGREPTNGANVLRDIDLEVLPGQSLGIIGENGAGKSTLLKILTGVIRPTRGSVDLRARTSALLELGAGFQPEFTGIENVRMNAALLGLSRSEVESRLDEILEFADIGEYINEPVKHYSSGMVVRLGFAVAVASRPDLLITDEVLAVGDESFQKKCIAWIESFLSGGGTLLMVSHSMYLVQKLCQRALWLQDGTSRLQGDVFPVTQAYLAWHEQKAATDQQGQRRAEGEAGLYRIERFTVRGSTDSGDAEPVCEMGESLDLELELVSPDGRAPVGLFGIDRIDGTSVYGVSSEDDGAAPLSTGGNQFLFRLSLERLDLLPGRYVIRGHALDPEGLRVCDTVERQFTVTGDSREFGLVRLRHRWG